MKVCVGASSAARGSKLKQNVTASIVVAVGRKRKCSMQLATRRASNMELKFLNCILYLSFRASQVYNI